MAHQTTINIRGYHCDAYGHVNNARYLELFEEARWQALSDFGVDKRIAQLGLQFFVVNIQVDFKKPVLPKTTVLVKTSLHNIGRKTMTFLQEIENEQGLATKAEITFVLFNPSENKAVNVTDDLSQLFNVFN
ncbi:MAG: acyl-CoA thioesterase [Flavobacteriales bacterium]|nr:acyl-CoA thioesterase [Flavobacteriales bacterium]